MDLDASDDLYRVGIASGLINELASPDYLSN